MHDAVKARYRWQIRPLLTFVLLLFYCPFSIAQTSKPAGADIANRSALIEIVQEVVAQIGEDLGPALTPLLDSSSFIDPKSFGHGQALLQKELDNRLQRLSEAVKIGDSHREIINDLEKSANLYESEREIATSLRKMIALARQYASLRERFESGNDDIAKHRKLIRYPPPPTHDKSGRPIAESVSPNARLRPSTPEILGNDRVRRYKEKKQSLANRLYREYSKILAWHRSIICLHSSASEGCRLIETLRDVEDSRFGLAKKLLKKQQQQVAVSILKPVLSQGTLGDFVKQCNGFCAPIINKQSEFERKLWEAPIEVTIIVDSTNPAYWFNITSTFDQFYGIATEKSEFQRFADATTKLGIKPLHFRSTSEKVEIDPKGPVWIAGTIPGLQRPVINILTADPSKTSASPGTKITTSILVLLSPLDPNDTIMSIDATTR